LVIDEFRVIRDNQRSVGITYELYRAEGNGIFQLLGEFIATEEDTMTYIDSDVRPWEVIYTYFWRAFDGCGELIGDSNSGRNIVVSGRTLENEIVNRLNWNTYEEWENGVEEYRVFRSLGDPEDFQLLTTLSPGFTEFEDDVEEFKEVEGRFCYRIEAVESPNQFGSGAVALSNTICVVQPPIAWIPNAIVLGGFNDEFRPVLGFIDFESYAMEIYNKWGELLFETRDYAEAWDGTYRGNPVPEDYYRYIISFRDGQGKPVIEEGVLYVLIGAE
jgi:gliding motility-associated-like protein